MRSKFEKYLYSTYKRMQLTQYSERGSPYLETWDCETIPPPTAKAHHRLAFNTYILATSTLIAHNGAPGLLGTLRTHTASTWLSHRTQIPSEDHHPCSQGRPLCDIRPRRRCLSQRVNHLSQCIYNLFDGLIKGLIGLIATHTTHRPANYASDCKSIRRFHS